MTTLVAWFLSNPTIIAIGAAIVAAAGAWVHGRLSGAKAQANADKAKEADSYAKHIKDISDAANARPSGGVQSDPYNRDNG
ncbi:hypothetical protein FJ973_29570 [Mesorhizobium sp. B2-1-3]|uniref:hypothetical protein n=1 Tax=Mesorhizobium sp. B2-1-3 TaxID=2589972 RepID=UPI001126F928|nr:hypothetical protein [Mesorhizobium sp. B2-1-3]TPN03795.1 hypothetical protein FJ973_29570 [Mesorhizobium sp. B2-1-3]